MIKIISKTCQGNAQKVIKKLASIFPILAILILSSAFVSADRYVNWHVYYGYWDVDSHFFTTSTPITDSSMINYVCSSAGCGSVSGVLGSGSSGPSNLISNIFPTTLMSPYGYGLYFYKPGYITWEVSADYWGDCPWCDPQENNVYIGKKVDCQSAVQSMAITSPQQVGVPITATASIPSALPHGGPLDYVPPSLKDAYYSVYTDIMFQVIRVSDSAVINTQTTSRLIPFSSSAPVSFTWTPPAPGDYRLIITTTIGGDSKCLSFIPRSDERLVSIPGCVSDSDCDDGVFCNGAETCNMATFTCQSGTPVTCNDGLYCNGLETCNEATDSCQAGTAPVCTDGQFCNGLETCNEATDSCQAGTPPACNNGQWCDGTETCNEATDSCQAGTPPACNNGQWCDGTETCNEATDSCQAGTTVDCSANNLPEIATCTNVPDSIDATWDHADGFTSTCNEAADSCTTGSYSYTHSCSIASCGAECESDPDCNSHCVGDTYYYDGDCLSGCTCDYDSQDCNVNDGWYDTGISQWVSTGACTEKEQKEQEYRDYTCGASGCEYSITSTQWVDTGLTQNKPDGTTCDDGAFCTLDDQCVSGTCTGSPRDCDNGIYCDGAEYCDENADSCMSGPVVDCDDSIGCTLDSCNEAAQSCDNTPDDSICDNGLFCDGAETCDITLDCQAGTPPACDNGQYCDGAETCNEATDSCDAGTPVTCDDGQYCNGVETCNEAMDTCWAGAPVDCSADDLPEIARCDNSPDDNSMTWDYAAGFSSGCIEATDTCSTGSYSFSHTCDVSCGAECVSDSDCTDYPDGSCLSDCTCDYVLPHDIAITTSYANSVHGVRLTHANFTPINEDIAVIRTNRIYKLIFKTINEGNYDETVDFEAYLYDEYGNPVYAWFPTPGFLTIPGFLTRTLTLNTGYIGPGLYSFDVNASIIPPESDYSDNERVRMIRVAECINDGDCDNGLWCDGEEYCDSNYECQSGAAPDCNDDVSCTVDSCDEDADSCVNTPNDNICDNGLWCDGSETCDAVMDCQSGDPVDCGDGVGCTVDSCDEGTDSCDNTPDDNICDNGLFCDGAETCDATLDCQAGTTVDCGDGVGCTVDSCNEGTDSCDNLPDDSICDNGLWCDGAETCDTALDCQAGTAVDCSSNDLPEIAACDNSPDDNDLTWDFAAGFSSTCDDSADSCTTGSYDYTHTCDSSSCGAGCESDSDCDDTDCDFLDGCVGNDYYDYSDVANTCEGCACTDNSCSSPSISYNDPRCVNCTVDSDCDALDRDYCDGDVVMHDEGMCVNYQCQAFTDPEIDCDTMDDTYCSGTQVMTDDYTCDSGSCVLDSHDSFECDDGLYCDGQETCDSGACVDADDVDCSTFDLAGIATCNNVPDNNSVTWDYFAGFTSSCDEASDSCTTGSVALTHTCETSCGADARCDGILPNTGNCTVQCKYKPPVRCYRDGQFGVDFIEGHEYVCKDDNTYYRCNANGSAYVHVNVCSYYCSADLACEGKIPGASLNSCDEYGEDYLEDYCDMECQLQDDNCESGFAGCTADAVCDELAPGTGDCSMECQWQCSDDSDCDSADDDYCLGSDLMHDEGRCVLGSCEVQTTTVEECDDGIFCNGIESCNAVTLGCDSTAPLDCSSYDIPGFEVCDNSPDDNPFTLDYFAGFTSECDEATQSCTTGIIDITHTCDTTCGAECSDDSDCDPLDCGEGCSGYSYFSCDNIHQSCVDCECNSVSCPPLDQCQWTGTDYDQDTYDEECGDCDDDDDTVYPGAPEICDYKDNDCDGDIDEGLIEEFFRISYSTRDTGDVLYIDDYDCFTEDNIDFFHGYVHNNRGSYQGFGSLAARTVTCTGEEVKINIKFDVTELLEQDCEHITWRNYARGTYWVYNQGLQTITLDYMDITYHTSTGMIDAVGVGDIGSFELKLLVDNNFIG